MGAYAGGGDGGGGGRGVCLVVVVVVMMTVMVLVGRVHVEDHSGVDGSGCGGEWNDLVICSDDPVAVVVVVTVVFMKRVAML